MNTLFDITNDADILTKPLANRAEIRAFENDGGEGHGPVAPYLPDLSNIKGAWNHALLLVFMEEYTNRFMVEDEDDQDEIIDYFRTCETSSLQVAQEELADSNYNWEQLKIMRIKFLSEYCN